MKALFLIPHALRPERHEQVRRGERPEADYDGMAEAIRATPGGRADILDMKSLDAERSWVVRLVRRWLGDNWGLAMLAFLRRRDYDVISPHSELVALPLSLMFLLTWRRPRHVTTAIYLNGRRNALWYRVLRSHKRIDKIFVLSPMQYAAGRSLGIEEDRLLHVESVGYVDIRFFLNRPAVPVNERQLGSAGREFRDFPTLIKAAAGLPDVSFKIDPTSTTSFQGNSADDVALPPNVEICSLPFGTIWRLYAESAVVVVPMRPNPIGAGSTVLVEAMAMGKPVIITRTSEQGFAGRADLIDGENVMLVKSGDVDDMRRAIKILMNDPALRKRMGENARRWAERRADRQEWLAIMLGAHETRRVATDLRGRETPATSQYVGHELSRKK